MFHHCKNHWKVCNRIMHILFLFEHQCSEIHKVPQIVTIITKDSKVLDAGKASVSFYLLARHTV